MRYRFVQDDDYPKHWYMIPADKYSAFKDWKSSSLLFDLCTKEELISLGIDPTLETYFKEFCLDGIENYIFENPVRDNK